MAHVTGMTVSTKFRYVAAVSKCLSCEKFITSEVPCIEVPLLPHTPWVAELSPHQGLTTADHRLDHHQELRMGEERHVSEQGIWNKRSCKDTQLHTELYVRLENEKADHKGSTVQVI